MREFQCAQIMREPLYLFYYFFRKITISYDASLFWRGRHIEFSHFLRKFVVNARVNTTEMAEYFKFLRQLLALSGESFEDELRRLVSFLI